MPSIWSLDDGYADNKGHNGEKLIILPSYCTDWRPRLDKDLADSDLNDPYAYLESEIDGEKYLLGKGAILQDSNIAWNGRENKHLDHYFAPMLKTCLALMAKSAKTELEPLVMGLPVKADLDEKRHELLKDIVIGNHKVRIRYTDGTEFDREIIVKDLIIKKQPFGSFCDVIMDRTGEIVDPELASKVVVIADIGGGTFNIYTLDALEPIYDLSDTTNDGMYQAYEQIGDYIELHITKTTLPTGKLPYIIEKREVKGYDITPIIESAYARHANQIIRVLEGKLRDYWGLVGQVIFTGGGAEVLRPWLEKFFNRDVPVMFLDRGSTASGLQKYGVFHEKRSRKGKVVAKASGDVGEVSKTFETSEATKA